MEKLINEKPGKNWKKFAHRDGELYWKFAKKEKREESKIERLILPIGGKIYIIGSNMKIYESEKNHRYFDRTLNFSQNFLQLVNNRFETFQ